MDSIQCCDQSDKRKYPYASGCFCMTVNFYFRDKSHQLRFKCHQIQSSIFSESLPVGHKVITSSIGHELEARCITGLSVLSSWIINRKSQLPSGSSIGLYHSHQGCQQVVTKGQQGHRQLITSHHTRHYMAMKCCQTSQKLDELLSCVVCLSCQKLPRVTLPVLLGNICQVLSTTFNFLVNIRRHVAFFSPTPYINSKIQLKHFFTNSQEKNCQRRIFMFVGVISLRGCS